LQGLFFKGGNMTENRSERLYPTRPMVGVGAVVWRDGTVLLERRGQPPAQGTWSLPGGLVDVGETLEQAVRREVREECGIDVEVGPLLGVFEPIQRDADGRIRYHYVVIDFLATFTSGEAVIGDDAAELCWAAIDELDAYALLPATRDMIERARQVAAS
jgi:8-oxo-dGTP diphosphatase